MAEQRKPGRLAPPSAPPQWHVPLADISVDEALVAAVAETCASGWWSMGPRVHEFEERFASYLGTRHALAVSSGTAALHLAFAVVGCGPGDEVVLPSLNFVAAANAVVQTGAGPVFCDIAGPLELNLTPDGVEGAIGPATRAVLALHYGGFACDMDGLLEVATAHGVALIEDAAHAPGARFNGRFCGTMGHVGCFSFFSNKNLPTGEGGMLVTDDDELAAKLRLLRSHGMTTLTWDRHAGHADSYEVVVPGFNYRLDELRATIGSVQLERLERENAGRRAIAALYRTELEGVEGLRFAFPDASADDSAHHLAVVVLPEGLERSHVREQMRERGVQTSVHYPPIHRFTAYADVGRRRPLPQTEAVAPRLLTLPLFAHMSEWQIGRVIESLLEAL